MKDGAGAQALLDRAVLKLAKAMAAPLGRDAKSGAHSLALPGYRTVYAAVAAGQLVVTTDAGVIRRVATGTAGPRQLDAAVVPVLTWASGPVTVSELGRVYLNGNAQNHEVALFLASTGAKVASVVWTPVGGVHNQIKHLALGTPVVLPANTEYYLASWEVSGGDSWYSSDTVLTTTGVAAWATSRRSSRRNSCPFMRGMLMSSRIMKGGG